MLNGLKELVQLFQREVQVYRAIMTDARCPRLSRWLLAAAVAYALSPVDLIPDFIPILGHLDDALILPLLVWWALRLVPKALVDEHRMRLSAEVCASNREGRPVTERVKMC